MTHTVQPHSGRNSRTPAPARRGFSAVLLLVLLASLFLSGCSVLGADQSQPADQQALEVDFRLREFYWMLGGADVLGPPISSLFSYGDMQCQYSENALMCYNPLAAGVDRYSLYPVGSYFGMSDQVVDAAQYPTERVVDGYVVYSGFVERYDEMIGSRFVGRPLTQARINYDQRRIEQYFENVGFYRLLDDPAGETHLLPYGVYACDNDCRAQAGTSSFIPMRSAGYQQPFISAISGMGGLADFGQPLTDPYIAADGNLEQVYANVVVYSPVDNPDQAILRPAANLLGMPVSLPGPQLYTEAEGVVFYPVQDGIGYHIPIVFNDFINRHGGMRVAGQPLSDVAQVEGGIYRQCYQNYCLDYIPAAPDGQKVQMTSLGALYLSFQQSYNAQTSAPLSPYSPQSVALQASELNPRVPATDNQVVNILVLSSDSGQPIANLEASISVLYPDGSQISLTFPPTGADGVSSVTIAARADVPNGAVIPYQVCLNVPSEAPICTSQSYLIWNYK